VEAVKPLSFTLREKQTLAIIGENGSGKSTLAKMLAGMVEPTSGEVLIDDHPLTFGDYSFRSQRIRMIFQDPSTSLNPRQRISQILDFPLRLNTDLEPRRANGYLKPCVWLGCCPITKATTRICWLPARSSVWGWRAR
jgi:cationic peptide transport system ATP-binding protein